MFNSILIGIVQGLTEFFPVSSSAHVIVLEKLLGINDDGHRFAAGIHLATALAAIIYFRKDIFRIIKGMLNMKSSNNEKLSSKYGWNIIVATIPVIIIGYFIENSSFFEKLGNNLTVIGVSLALFGALLYYVDQNNIKKENRNSIAKEKKSLKGEKSNEGKNEPTYTDSLIIGASQLIAAVFPGASRSGVAFTSTFWRGINREEAARFVFLISIPVTILPGVYEIFIKKNLVVNTEFFLAFISAFLAGVFAIYFLFHLIKSSSLKWFCYYRVILGLGIIIYSLFLIK